MWRAIHCKARGMCHRRHAVTWLESQLCTAHPLRQASHHQPLLAAPSLPLIIIFRYPLPRARWSGLPQSASCLLRAVDLATAATSSLQARTRTSGVVRAHFSLFSLFVISSALLSGWRKRTLRAVLRTSCAHLYRLEWWADRTGSPTLVSQVRAKCACQCSDVVHIDDQYINWKHATWKWPRVT